MNSNICSNSLGKSSNMQKINPFDALVQCIQYSQLQNEENILIQIICDNSWTCSISQDYASFLITPLVFDICGGFCLPASNSLSTFFSLSFGCLLPSWDIEWHYWPLWSVRWIFTSKLYLPFNILHNYFPALYQLIFLLFLKMYQVFLPNNSRKEHCMWYCRFLGWYCYG